MTEDLPSPAVSKTLVETADAALAIARKIFKRWKGKQEVMVILHIDTQLRLIGRPWIAGVGGLHEVNAHPRDVFREAIIRNCRGIIMVHNHPSGHAEPSMVDTQLTQRIKESGVILGIQLFDHIIDGGDHFVSMAGRKML